MEYMLTSATTPLSRTEREVEEAEEQGDEEEMT